MNREIHAVSECIPSVTNRRRQKIEIPQLEGSLILPHGGRASDDGKEQDQGHHFRNADVSRGVDGSGE